MNVSLVDDVDQRSAEAQRRWMNYETDFYMPVLAVSPSYQRLGLGSRLVKVGLDAADKVGAMVYFEASPLGLPLYLNLGFTPVEEIAVDLRKYGGEGGFTRVCLIRASSVPNGTLSDQEEADETK